MVAMFSSLEFHSAVLLPLFMLFAFYLSECNRPGHPFKQAYERPILWPVFTPMTAIPTDLFFSICFCCSVLWPLCLWVFRSSIRRERNRKEKREQDDGNFCLIFLPSDSIRNTIGPFPECKNSLGLYVDPFLFPSNRGILLNYGSKCSRYVSGVVPLSITPPFFTFVKRNGGEENKPSKKFRFVSSLSVRSILQMASGKSKVLIGRCVSSWGFSETFNTGSNMWS